MKIRISSLTAASVCAGVLFTLAGSACLADTITIPKGIDVPLVFDQELSSKTAKKGDTVPLHVDADVFVSNTLVFKRGTTVTGIITEVKHRSNFGVNARLRLAFNPVHTELGASIDIGPKVKGKATGRRTDEAAAISGGAAIVLGPVGLVGGYFVVGKQVTIKKGDHLTGEVVRDTDIVR